MIATLAASLLIAGTQGLVQRLGIDNPNILVQVNQDRLQTSRLSPKSFDGQKWEFDWLATGFGNLGEEGVKKLRVRVYSQERKQVNDKAPLVARMMMQIWDKLFRRYRIDHPIQYHDGLVDVFLCFGGEPGGEQEIGSEFTQATPAAQKANTIYFYQLSSFKDPVEMAREVAHEYGHAVLPPVGGFKKPEDWGNGYLGEKIFMRWLRDDFAAGRLITDDVMGATKEQVDAWVKKNVDPLILRAATNFPDASNMMEGSTGMDNWIGLAAYVDQICPPQVFANSLRFTTMRPPTDYPDQVVAAARAMDQLTLSVPSTLAKQKFIWIPLGEGKIAGATVLKKKNGWAQVVPLMPNIVITNRLQR